MIKLPAYFTRFGSRADGSAGLSFATQELTPEDFIELSKTLNRFGWLIFKENEIKPEEIPDEDVEESKRPSKRLRNTLFILWQQQKVEKDFEIYYREQIEKIIEYIKNKLD